MIVHVAPSIPVAKTFSYGVPHEWGPFISRFQRVKVPFHNRTITGFIMDVEEGDDSSLKELEEIVDPFSLIHGSMLPLGQWASRHYVTPMGVVLKYMLPATLQVGRYLTVEALEDGAVYLQGLSLAKAVKSAGMGTILRHLYEGSIRLKDLFTGKLFRPAAAFETGGPPINTLFVGEIESRLEYYCSLIAAHLGAGNNVLMLLPDYHGIGKYVHRRLTKKIGKNILWYGTSIKGAARMESYFRAQSETGNLILGNKSAVFLPVNHLSLIIVDRQEEDEFRNEEGFKYNANVVAKQRGSIEHVPLVFGSASPSAEIMKEVDEQTITFTRGGWLAGIPWREIREEKNGPRRSILPDTMVRIAEEAVNSGEKLAIYTPKKDYGSFIRCLDCKKHLSCPQCDGVLSYQKNGNSLVCPSCNKTLPYEGTCSYCGSSLIHITRPGAEYFESIMAGLFKDVPVLRVGSDTLGKSIQAFKDIPGRSPAILVGTQVLSKMYGLRIDKLIIAGWEELFRMSGYRANERIFQIFMNLVDALKPGEVYIVTGKKNLMDPSLFSDPDRFYAEELNRRKVAEFPPYARMFLLELEKASEEAGARVVGEIHRILEEEDLWNHVTGPLLQKRKRCRWRYILKGQGETFYRALWRLYDLPGLRIEADPLNV
jgi:primosomal protein N' (replication factor Y)